LTKQVADRLHLSEFTVRSYLKTIYCKLGVRSRGAMVFRYAQGFKADGLYTLGGLEDDSVAATR
jgi:Bacterial regulatory proteins, luxR family